MCVLRFVLKILVLKIKSKVRHRYALAAQNARFYPMGKGVVHRSTRGMVSYSKPHASRIHGDGDGLVCVASLPYSLVQADTCRDRHIETLDHTGHGQAHQEIAAFPGQATQASALGAHGETVRPENASQQKKLGIFLRSYSVDADLSNRICRGGVDFGIHQYRPNHAFRRKQSQHIIVIKPQR